MVQRVYFRAARFYAAQVHQDWLRIPVLPMQGKALGVP